MGAPGCDADRIQFCQGRPTPGREGAGVFVVSFVSSPGTGKTCFLQSVMKSLLDSGERVAAVTGDLATDNDARRLASTGAPVRQIETDGICHLEAEMLASHLEGWDLAELDYLLIENVGNLVCPSSYDLGEQVRVAMLSVSEGEYKPLKYPTLFNSADVPSPTTRPWSMTTMSSAN